MHPPPIYRPPGRPKHNRYKDGDETNPEKRKQKQCSKCGILGHNKKGCKGAPAPRGPGGKRIRVDAEGPAMQHGNTTPLVIPIQPDPRTNLGISEKKRGRGGGKRRFIPPLSTPPVGPSTPSAPPQ